MKLFKTENFQSIISSSALEEPKNFTSNEFSESDMDLYKKEGVSVLSLWSNGAARAKAMYNKEILAESNQMFKGNAKSLLNGLKRGRRRQKQIGWTKSEEEILFALGKKQMKKKWNIISKILQNKTPSQCYYHFNSCNPQIKRRNWSCDEDSKILQLFKIYGRKWEEIARCLKNRTGKQVRDRFLNRLDNSINHSKFTETEDQLIYSLYMKYGASWSKISNILKTRSSDMIKSRFYSSIKKRFLENAPNFNSNLNSNVFNFNSQSNFGNNLSNSNFDLLEKSEADFLGAAGTERGSSNASRFGDKTNLGATAEKMENDVKKFECHVDQCSLAAENCLNFFENKHTNDNKNLAYCGVASKEVLNLDGKLEADKEADLDCKENKLKEFYFNEDYNRISNQNIAWMNECINSVPTHFSSKRNSFEFENQKSNEVVKTKEEQIMKLRESLEDFPCFQIKSQADESKKGSYTAATVCKIQGPNKFSILNNFGGCFSSILSQNSSSNANQILESNYQSKNDFRTYLTAGNEERKFCSDEFEELSASKCKSNYLCDENMTQTASDYSDEECDM